MISEELDSKPILITWEIAVAAFASALDEFYRN